MKKVYIIHPFQGLDENKRKIAEICRKVLAKGYFPISPVHALSFLDDTIPEERAKALELCLDLLGMCEIAFVFGDWANSVGCRQEIIKARRRGIIVVFVVDFDTI